MAAADGVVELKKKLSKMGEGKSDQKLSSFGLPKLWHDVDIASAKFLLSEEKLANPPSLVDGMDADLERNLRFLGCEMIQTAAILLKLPQVAAATAQILYQRYFYSKSFVRNSFEDVAMACLVLASKIEEAPRRNRDIINVFHHLKQLSRLRSQPEENRRKPTPLLVDHNYVTIKNRVIKAERRVLKELGFVVHVKHPHKLVTGYLKALNLDRSRLIIQKAWNYMNDGLRTDVFVRYSAETIACACIFLAARVCKVPLPMESAAPGFRPWWELFNAAEKDILEICRMLLNQYIRLKTPSWKRLEIKVAELREKLQDRQKARQEAMGADTTPNPHGTGTGDKFSPNVQSRLGSPKKDGVSRKLNGEAGDNFRVRKDQQKRRSKSSSSEGSSPPSVRKKDLPKRYSGSSKDRRIDKKRRRSRSGSPVPQFRSKINRSNFDFKDRRGSGGKRERSPISPPGTGTQPNWNPSVVSKGGKVKEKDRDRENKQARKDREREVKLALGKRKRGSMSPVERERKEKDKGAKYR